MKKETVTSINGIILHNLLILILAALYHEEMEKLFVKYILKIRSKIFSSSKLVETGYITDFGQTLKNAKF